MVSQPIQSKQPRLTCWRQMCFQPFGRGDFFAVQALALRLGSPTPAAVLRGAARWPALARRLRHGASERQIPCEPIRAGATIGSAPQAAGDQLARMVRTGAPSLVRVSAMANRIFKKIMVRLELKSRWSIQNQ